jgi:hypothetical protein
MYLFTLTVLSLILNPITSSPLLPRQATNGPHPPTILWSCLGNSDPILNIPSVCSNMCYGAYCRGYGSTLTWDTSSNLPPGWTPLIRKVNAGCYVGVGDNGTGIVGQEDRCQRQGLACSVYPYVTASDGDVNVQRGGPVSRCVDMGEDARKYLLYPSPFHPLLEHAISDNKTTNRSIRHPQFPLHIHRPLVKLPRPQLFPPPNKIPTNLFQRWRNTLLFWISF